MNTWVFKINTKRGWEFDQYFRSPARGSYELGDEGWIRSASSLRYIREEVKRGDLFLCYEVDRKRIVGIARAASDGRDTGMGSLLAFCPPRDAVRLTNPLTRHPDLDLAQTLAQRAVDLAEDGVLKSIYLDTLARVQFMKGNKEEAIALEQKALDLIAGNDKSKDLGQKIQRALDDFKQGELPKPIWERLKPAAKQTAGKNSSGDRREVMLWGDGHVEFYQFPPDVQDEMFSSDPNPNYVFWEGQFPASTAPGEHQFDGGLRALNARFDQLL